MRYGPSKKSLLKSCVSKSCLLLIANMPKSVNMVDIRLDIRLSTDICTHWPLDYLHLASNSWDPLFTFRPALIPVT